MCFQAAVQRGAAGVGPPCSAPLRLRLHPAAALPGDRLHSSYRACTRVLASCCFEPNVHTATPRPPLLLSAQLFLSAQLLVRQLRHWPAGVCAAVAGVAPPDGGGAPLRDAAPHGARGAAQEPACVLRLRFSSRGGVAWAMRVCIRAADCQFASDVASAAEDADRLHMFKQHV
jgi:hypothetical protein